VARAPAGREIAEVSLPRGNPTLAGAATHTPPPSGDCMGRPTVATVGHPHVGRAGAGHGRVDGSARCRARAVAAGARRLGHPHHPSAAGRATGTSLRSAPAPRGGLRPPTRAPPRASDAARAVGGPTWCSAATAARARGRNAAGDGRGPHGRGRRASDGMVQIVPS